MSVYYTLCQLQSIVHDDLCKFKFKKQLFSIEKSASTETNNGVLNIDKLNSFKIKISYYFHKRIIY